MGITAIIVSTFLVLVIGLVLFVWYHTSSLYKYVEKKYAEFEKNRSDFSDSALARFKADVGLVMDQLDERIKNQENFINNTHPESEYADSIYKAKESLTENKRRRSRCEKMLQEIRYERNRRDHARKYK